MNKGIYSIDPESFYDWGEGPILHRNAYTGLVYFLASGIKHWLKSSPQFSRLELAWVAVVRIQEDA